MDHLNIVNDLYKTGNFMRDQKLVWGTAGNISARIDDSHFYVSASGTVLGDMELEDFSLCSKNGYVSGKKPSKEHIMHQGIYNQREDVGAILHASPFYSTIIACSDIELPSNYFVESMYYLERIERIPYHHPGSQELAEAVEKKAKAANIMLLENHGVIVYDKNLKEARMALQTLEYTAKMHVTAKKSSVNMKQVSNQTEKDFLQNSGYKPKRNWSDNE